MAERIVVRKGTYYDSVTLMLASRDAESVPGVSFAAAVAATPLNLALLAERGFTPPELSPNDLVVAIKGQEEASDIAVAAVERRLSGDAPAGDVRSEVAPAPSIVAAARRNPAVTMAFVSVPDPFAAYEIAAAIEAGLDVFCFSGGPSLRTEAVLKARALERGVLLMGPDCGTAIIDGVGFGFANAVQRGPVGIVGASGTGVQEISCLLDEAGVGISHAIGVGGRDLTAEVGALMTLRVLELLADDPATKVIVVVSKPPDPRVASVVAGAAAKTGRPVAFAFPGGNVHLEPAGGTVLCDSLEGAAIWAAQRCGANWERLEPSPERISSGRVRGLFCGGTLCYEAMAALGRGHRVASNVPLRPEWQLENVEVSRGHTFIDFGSPGMTQGRAHPMIDPTLRNARFGREARDPETGVIVIDVVLGSGADPDPAARLAPLIANAISERDELSVVVAVCGTPRDPQGLDSQAAALEEAGALVTRGAARAGRIAGAIAGLRND